MSANVTIAAANPTRLTRFALEFNSVLVNNSSFLGFIRLVLDRVLNIFVSERENYGLPLLVPMAIFEVGKDLLFGDTLLLNSLFPLDAEVSVSEIRTFKDSASTTHVGWVNNFEHRSQVPEVQRTRFKYSKTTNGFCSLKVDDSERNPDYRRNPADLINGSRTL